MLQSTSDTTIIVCSVVNGPAFGSCCGRNKPRTMQLIAQEQKTGTLHTCIVMHPACVCVWGGGGGAHAGQEALCTYTSWYAYAAMFGSSMIQTVHRSPYVQCQTAQSLVLPCFVDQYHWSAMLPQGRASYCLL